MRARFLTGVSCLAASFAVAASVSTLAQRFSAEPRTVAVPPPDGSQSRRVHGRVFLSPEQSAQTRDAASWPTEVRSLLSIDRRLGFGEWVWNDRGVPAGRVAVRVDLAQQLISVTRGGHEVGTAVVLYGSDDHATPSGRFPILSKAVDHRSRAYDAPMPHTLWLTTDGVALHGSSVRSGVATHGCIGLPPEFARRLFEQAKPGDQVLIV
jgi:hypothetical protein